MRARLAVITLAAAAAAVVTVAAVAADTRDAAEPAALPGLPRDVRGFERWPKLAFKPLPNRGGTAHHGVKRVYVNRKRSALLRGGKQRFPYPYGTIVVKTASEGGVVTLVAIGRKKRGFDRAHGDWEFIEYSRESSSERFSELASGQVCYSCHVGAKKTDWIFTKAK